MSDTKAIAPKKLHDQADPDLYAHIVERRPDGVVIQRNLDKAIRQAVG